MCLCCVLVIPGRFMCSNYKHYAGQPPPVGWRYRVIIMHYIDVTVSATVSNHRRLDCLLNTLCRRKSKKTSKLRSLAFVRGIHRWQRANDSEKVSIWWRHYGLEMAQCHMGDMASRIMVIIGSDNGLSPVRRQAIIWTNAELSLIRSLGIKLNEI